MKKSLFLSVLLAASALSMVSCGNKENKSEEPKASEQEQVRVMSYSEYVAAEVDDDVVIETYVQDKQSWWDNKATLYTQDHDGAYFIYNMVCSEEDYAKLVPGTKIRVTGTKAEWAGEVELGEGATFEFVEGADSYIASALDVTSLLGTDDLIKHQNEFVSFKNAEVVASRADGSEEDVAWLYNYNGTGVDGNDLYFSVKFGDTVYQFTVESYLRGAGTDVYEAVKNLQIGDIIDMEGFLYWYNGANPHIVSVSVANN